MEKKEIELRAKIAGLKAKESFYNTMGMHRLEPLKGIKKFIPSERKKYKDTDNFLKGLTKLAEETAAKKNEYKKELYDIKHKKER